MEPIWIDFLGGIILLICGVLVKRFPILISGYNTLSAEKKKNVDIAGLSSFMRRHLLIIGSTWIALATLPHLTGAEEISPAIYIICVIYVLIYAIWIVVRSQRFYHNK